MRAIAILTLLALTPALGGCGAIVAGAAGGLVVNEVIKHQERPYYPGWGRYGHQGARYEHLRAR
jgi:hypothetical protein